MNDEKVLTIGQYLEQTAVFELSVEYQDMLRESYELDLMDRFLEAQAFLAESEESGEYVETYGLITEASKEKIADVAEQAEKKRGNIFQRLFQWILKGLKAIASFFKGFYEKWLMKKPQAIYDMASLIEDELHDKDKLNLVKENIEKIRKTVLSAAGLDSIDALSKGSMVALPDSENNSETAYSVPTIRGINKQIKKIDKELAAALDRIAPYLNQKIKIKMPKITSKVSDLSKEIANVISIWGETEGGLKKNTSTNQKTAITSLLSKLKKSKNEYDDVSIDAIWIKSRANAIAKTRDKTERLYRTLSNRVNKAYSRYETVDDKRKKTGIRSDLGDAFSGISTQLTELCKVFVEMSNAVINDMKTVMDRRNKAMAIELAFLKAVRRAIGAPAKMPKKTKDDAE